MKTTMLDNKGTTNIDQLKLALEDLQKTIDLLINANEQNNPANLLDESEMARFFGIKPNTAAKWRSEGKGPEYIKMNISGNIRYPMGSIQEFIKIHTITR